MTARYHVAGEPFATDGKSPNQAGKPLYLDCCALVRRAVQDCQDDFGFRIGRWNQARPFVRLIRGRYFLVVKPPNPHATHCHLYQAYQFDTLPVARDGPTADGPGDLQPGDLIFVEATYHTGRHRQQKHSMVHVEIYLGSEYGTGPLSTLGSRKRWGCVEVHDSFRYASQFYDIHGFHWRSLDTWLAGKCEPTILTDAYTSHDPYGDVEERVGRRSVFSAADGEAADGDDAQLDDDLTRIARGGAAAEVDDKAAARGGGGVAARALAQHRVAAEEARAGERDGGVGGGAGDCKRDAK